MSNLRKRPLSPPTDIDNHSLKKSISSIKIINKYDVIINPSGMTLIEILITIVILSLALLALSGMQVSAFHVSKNSNQLTTAMISTQDAIELLMSIDFNHASLVDNTPPGESTSYALETALNLTPPPGVHVNWTIDDQTGSMKLVNITTKWLDRGVEKSISLPLRRTSFQ